MTAEDDEDATMPASPIKINGRTLRLYKCIVAPDFQTKTILDQDPFDYVEMWLRVHGTDKALYHWRQAEAFASASRDLPNLSSPLTRYYAAENAVEALLLSNGITPTPSHGCTGANITDNISLADEKVKIGKEGILSGLCDYLGETVQKDEYSLDEIFYNLVYIHRAYTVTNPAKPELFIPISEPHFVNIDGTKKSFFRCTIPDRNFYGPDMLARLSGWERDNGVSTDKNFVLRLKKRFDWIGPDDPDSLKNFCNYYSHVRQATHYIAGPVRLWYLKMSDASPDVVDRSPLTLTLMALHRLSEMSRYHPDLLAQHLETAHNWLLAQFIDRSLNQFLEQIAAEITKHEFMPPSYAVR